MDLNKEIEKIAIRQPNLTLSETSHHIILRGNYSYNLRYTSNIYSGETKVEIHIPKNYPESFPILYLLEAPENMEHIYKNKEVCLASIGEIVNHLAENNSLVDFIDKFVDPFIYSMNWFKEYGNYVFEERSHGIEGLLEYYVYDLGLSLNSYYKMSLMVKNENYRGHRTCFCGSGKRLRDCHNDIVFSIMTNKSVRQAFIKEFEMISNILWKIKIKEAKEISKSMKGKGEGLE